MPEPSVVQDGLLQNAGVIGDTLSLFDQKNILNISESQQNATEFRLNRLPQINAKGIAFVMGCSRMLMLVQYAVGKYNPHPLRISPHG